MSLPQIVLDPPTLKLILLIVTSLLVISMVRIIFLLRTNNRLRESTEKMEKQVVAQHNEIMTVRKDSNAWRGDMQRVFDAFRAEFSNRLVESEQRYQEIQRRIASVPPPPESGTAAPEAAAESGLTPVPALSLS